eukprot:SAG11_NODE_3128_length_2665_cov_1.692518_1_plen_114_part_10
MAAGANPAREFFVGANGWYSGDTNSILYNVMQAGVQHALPRRPKGQGEKLPSEAKSAASRKARAGALQTNGAAFLPALAFDGAKVRYEQSGPGLEPEPKPQPQPQPNLAEWKQK